MRLAVLPACLLIFLALPSIADDDGFFGKTKEAKNYRELKDPLTGETFRQPLDRTTEVVWTDRFRRPVSIGEHPRLYNVWVSPHTGFATLPDPGLWKQIAEKSDAGAKDKIKNELKKYPRRYRHVAAVPALHRYELAILTYRAMNRLGEERAVHLYMRAAWCAMDEGNEKAASKYRKLLLPILKRRAENESLATEQLVRSGYMAAEASRLEGDLATAEKLFRQADSRIRRYKVARELRIPSRLAVAELDWKDKTVDELNAIIEGPDEYDCHVARLLLVDRGAGEPLRKILKKHKKHLELRKDIVRRAMEKPHAGLIPALKAALLDDEYFIAASAAQAMGRIDSDEAVKTLIEALADEDEERLVLGLAESTRPMATKELARLAEKGSGFGGRPAAAKALLDRPGAEVGEALVRHVAVAESYNLSSALLIATKAGPAVFPALRAAIKSETDNKRLANLLALAGQVTDAESAAAAAAHLGHSDSNVALHAAMACAQKGQGVSKIAPALQTATGPDRARLLTAAGWLRDVKALKAACTPQARSENYPAYLAALKAAGRTKSSALKEILIEALSDNDPLVIAHAAHGLVRMGQKSKVTPLLKTAPYTVVSAIARAAAESGDKSMAKALEAALKADDGVWLGSLPGRGGPYDLPARELANALAVLR
ncbi:MAG: DUF2225 domain-containing protein [Planctomycetota bacterium]